MSNEESLQLFEDQPIRTAWSEEDEEWYFSVVDVVGVLTESADPNDYWKVLKKRLKNEGNQSVTNCNQLRLKSRKDGKRYKTDVATTEQLLRIIQSIPSKKAEPFKLWLAQVGRERIEETLDPELIAERLVSTYERRGYTPEWINQRLQAISARKELTDEVYKAWSGMSARQYKNFKGLKKESLRDNMSTTELTLNQLAETATREISQREQPDGFDASRSVARRGGRIAGNARKELEAELGQSIITRKNASQLNHVVTQMIEASAGVSIPAEDSEKDE